MSASMRVGEAELKLYGGKTVFAPCDPSGDALPPVLLDKIEALTGVRLGNVETHRFACSLPADRVVCLVPTAPAPMLYILEMHGRWFPLTASNGVPLNVATSALDNPLYSVCPPGAAALPAPGDYPPVRTAWLAATGVFRMLVVPLSTRFASPRSYIVPAAATGSVNPAADAPDETAWCHM